VSCRSQRPDVPSDLGAESVVHPANPVRDAPEQRVVERGERHLRLVGRQGHDRGEVKDVRVLELGAAIPQLAGENLPGLVDTDRAAPMPERAGTSSVCGAATRSRSPVRAVLSFR
jgi:hypothetical protein